MTDAAKATIGFLHPGTVATCFADSREGVMFNDAFGVRRLMHKFGQIGKRCGSGGIPDGRNALAQAVLDSDVEWLFMVDADMGFRADAMERLIDAADPVLRPVMGGLAFAHKQDGKSPSGVPKYRPCPTLYDYHQLDDSVGFIPRFDYKRNTVQEVSATGAAIILIHRSVLQTVADKYGPIWFDPIRHPKANFSEDLSFCIRLAACDITMFVDTGVRTSHDKGGVVHDEDSYDTWRSHQKNGGIPLD
jgi:hypothetical protein